MFHSETSPTHFLPLHLNPTENHHLMPVPTPRSQIPLARNVRWAEITHRLNPAGRYDPPLSGSMSRSGRRRDASGARGARDVGGEMGNGVREVRGVYAEVGQEGVAAWRSARSAGWFGQTYWSEMGTGHFDQDAKGVTAFVYIPAAEPSSTNNTATFVSIAVVLSPWTRPLSIRYPR